MSQQWTSRIGYILAAAGLQLVLAQSGSFLMLPPITVVVPFNCLLLFSFIIGLAVLLAENILGSSTHAEAVNAFKR